MSKILKLPLENIYFFKFLQKIFFFHFFKPKTEWLIATISKDSWSCSNSEEFSRLLRKPQELSETGTA